MDQSQRTYGPEDLIAIVNRHRHDWMNDLQVLFGYVQMNKQDKIKEYISRLSDKLTRESLVSKLADPNLVAYLLRFRAVSDRLGLEVVPNGEIDLTGIGQAGRRAAEWIPALIDAFEAAAHPEEAGHNRLTVALDWDGQTLAVDFAFAGAIRSGQLHAGLEPLLREAKSAGAEVSLLQGEETVDVRLRIGPAD